MTNFSTISLYLTNAYKVVGQMENKVFSNLIYLTNLYVTLRFPPVKYSEIMLLDMYNSFVTIGMVACRLRIKWRTYLSGTPYTSMCNDTAETRIRSCRFFKNCPQKNSQRQFSLEWANLSKY